MVSKTSQRKIDTMLTVASSAIERQEYVVAFENLQKAINISQNEPLAWHLMSIACNRMGRPDKAEEFLFASLNLNPENIQYWIDLARTQIDLGKAEEAKKSSLRALSIEPSNGEALKLLGNSFLNQKKYQEALPSFLKILESEPDDIYANWGVSYCLYKSGRITEVYPYLKKCMDSGQVLRFVFLMYGQYIAETESRVLESIDYFNKELSYDSGSPSAYAVLGRAYASIGELEKSLEYEKKHLSIKSKSKFVFDNLMMHIHYNPSVTNQEILELSNQYQTQIYPDFVDNKFRKSDFPLIDFNPAKSSLRLGFVSGDFKKHSMFSWLHGQMNIMRLHGMEIVCYCNNEADVATEIWKSEVDLWRDIKNLDDDEAAEVIREDKIDILIDLSGHTALNRLGVFARKPAPVQVTWLGQAGPIGVKRLDYMITDEVSVPEGEDADYGHKIYRMPNVFASFSAPDLDITITEPPCLQNNYVTFACFNTQVKINPKVLNLWVRLLKAVPSARLHLKGKIYKDQEFRKRINNFFGSRGVDPSRLILDTHNSNKIDYLKVYNDIDIALDPFPVGGGTTTHDLLWMGVPMITLYGKRMSNRASASILTSMGCQEMIAHDEEEYLQKAIDLTADFERIRTYKSSLRKQYLSAPFCDTQSFAKDLEVAFRSMWSETILGME